jgi:ribosome-associated heat shock protein Hsp15
LEARLDRWLWAVRLCPTRTKAGEVCRNGHVRVNGRVAKAASRIVEGDRIEARLRGRARMLEVRRPIDARVGAPVAIECYIDHTPPEPPRDPAVADRPRGAGRPTKRERRQLDRWTRGGH